MGWFFSKKKEVSREEFDGLLETIKKSFSNVKNDVSKIREKAGKTDEDLKEIHNTTGFLNQSIKDLNNKLDSSLSSARQSRQKIYSIEEEPTEEINEEQIPEKNKHLAIQRQWEDLTETQKTLVTILKKLQDEEGKEEISMKDLARERYPETNYSDVKAMISNYTDLLFEQGFIEKKRRRRETFLSITKKALPFVPKKQIAVKTKKQKDL